MLKTMRQFPDVAVARRLLAVAGLGPDPAAGGWSADRRAVDSVLGADDRATGRATDRASDRATGRSAPEVLAALTLVTGLRADLEQTERELIALARDRGTSWRAVATALGLSSRQAAEQRWLRLQAAAGRGREPGSVRRQRERQQKFDSAAGEDVVALRREAARLRTRLLRRPYRPDPRDPHQAAIRLAAQTLAAADQAPPGGLYDLVRYAVADLRRVPVGRLGRPLAQARDRVATLAHRSPPN